MDKGKTKNEIKGKILNIFKSQPFTPIAITDISKAIGTRDRSMMSAIRDVVSDLVIEGEIVKFNRIKFILSKDKINTKSGIISITRNYSGYVKLDDQKEGELDVEIDTKDLRQAYVLDGDKVEIAIYRTDRKGRKYGKIVRITKRTSKPVIGTINVYGSYAILKTNQLKTTKEIFIPKENIKKANDGEKVAVRIVDWPRTAKSPTGKVTDVLGKAGENDTEMHAILAEFDLPYSYPARLERIADKIESGITPEEIKKRRDMREVCTFTIDPTTAKDFDDALSIQKLPNGNWEVGIHIADVTFYVHPGDDIDGEGFQRATSIYLVDRTIPMLPEKLSNFLCSLRPDEEKLCFSAIFEMDDGGNIKNQWLGKTIIRSNRRFTYDEAQEIIEGKSKELKDEICTLDRLAKKLREARFKAGSINFERDEPQFELDNEGKPTRVYFKEIKDSNQLIEEFMLLANRSVAEYIGKMKKTFVYRIHDLPEEDKFEKFVAFIRRWGYKMKAVTGKKAGEELTSLLHSAKGTPEEGIISTLAIRTMSKAVYSTHNIGHYGLAFKYYTHFTSPIRRYPDMMVHRLLEKYLDGGNSVQASQWEEYCEHCSNQEVKAAEAERASIKYKMVEFMKDKIGNEFDGMITSLTEWGVYVELDDTRIEGMISLQNMNISSDYEFFIFNHEDYMVESTESNLSFTIGDKVRIVITRADLERKVLDFKLIGYYDKNGKLITK